jgi:hypothetical protein
VSLQLESLEDRVVPDATISVVPGNATISFSLLPQTTPITVQVLSSLGTVNSGTAQVELLVNGQPVTGATANVSNGQATVQLPVPGALLPGTFTLLEDYLQGATQLASAPGSLAVTPGASTGGGGTSGGGGGGGAGSGSSSGAGAAGQSQLQAAFEVAIDTAAILLQGNMAAEMELQIASAVFVGQSLPSDLVSDLLSHMGPAGGFAIPAIEAGIQFANSVSGQSS